MGALDIFIAFKQEIGIIFMQERSAQRIALVKIPIKFKMGRARCRGFTTNKESSLLAMGFAVTKIVIKTKDYKW